MRNGERLAVASARVGDRIRFAEEKQAYTVQARDARFLVCSKPFNARRTVLYTIIDTVEDVRGPENLIFGMGAETREQCEEMLGRLNGAAGPSNFGGFKSEVSSRHRIPLRVVSVSPARTRKCEGCDGRGDLWIHGVEGYCGMCDATGFEVEPTQPSEDS